MAAGKGFAVWFTGLPGSGKSTLARLTAGRLRRLGVKTFILSSDMLRKYLTPKPSYSEEERRLVYHVLAVTAKLLTESGVNVLIDATGNRRVYREEARRLIRRFAEIYVKCPLNLCVERETKRRKTLGAPRKIYEKAFKGVSPTVPGIGSPYEEPLNPELTLETDRLKPGEAADLAAKFIIRRFRLRKA
ncbi:MAG: adenylylsulfate kinase-like kinase [Candidatus Hecatellales archaeon B24]|nr:MAG: adenylylsulfate kinase-like kinase [Candidatus Hecatellales archaeon B24]